MAVEKGLRKHLWILFFLLPSLVGLSLFSVVPILTSLGLTFTEWDLLTPPKYVGLDNFRRLVGDQNFWKALSNTLFFIVTYIPLIMTVALVITIISNQTINVN